MTHVPTASELRILAASSTSLLGYGANCTTIIFDEIAGAGSKGRAVFDALLTSLGKRSGQRVIALGTRSPSGPADWWPRWLSATADQPRTHIVVLEGDADNCARSGRSGESQSVGRGRAFAVSAGS